MHSNYFGTRTISTTCNLLTTEPLKKKTPCQEDQKRQRCMNMMYSIFNQSKPKLTGSAETNDKLRTLVSHSEEQTPQLVDQISQHMMGKALSLETYVSQLIEVAQLPPLRVLYGMTAEDIADKNRLINDVLTNFESQLQRDYKAYERERQQNNVLIATLHLRSAAVMRSTPALRGTCSARVAGGRPCCHRACTADRGDGI
jgi:hypothetical protein